MNYGANRLEGKRENTLDLIVSKEKRMSLGRDAKWGALALAIISFLGQQVALSEVASKLFEVVENYHSPGTASPAEYITILSILMASAPFVLVIALFFVTIQGMRDRDELKIGPVHLAVGGALLFVAAKISNVLGFAPVRTPVLIGSPQYMFASMLEAYFNSYGLVLFASSFVVGILLGRAYRTLSN